MGAHALSDRSRGDHSGCLSTWVEGRQVVSQPLRAILAFLWWNISEGIEEIEDARKFMRRLDGLTEDEHSLLALALRDRRELKVFHERFPPW